MERPLGYKRVGPISVDVENGMVFLPLGSPSYDFYGADRKGQDLFANSLVALRQIPANSFGITRSCTMISGTTTCPHNRS